MEKQEFTKEQLEAIAIVDKLYSLKSDCDTAYNFIHKKNICYNSNHGAGNILFIVPNMLCSLVQMIENGELIYKDKTK